MPFTHTSSAPTYCWCCGLRIAVGFADERLQTLDILSAKGVADWKNSVKDSAHKVVSKHTFNKSGNRMLPIYALESGLIIQKIIINTGGLKPGCLGPAQSKFLPSLRYLLKYRGSYPVIN